jgi:hypothetical protein
MGRGRDREILSPCLDGPVNVFYRVCVERCTFAGVHDPEPATFARPQWRWPDTDYKRVINATSAAGVPPRWHWPP